MPLSKPLAELLEPRRLLAGDAVGEAAWAEVYTGPPLAAEVDLGVRPVLAPRIGPRASPIVDAEAGPPAPGDPEAEPNDDPADATPLVFAPGERASEQVARADGAIATPADIDYFSFSLTEQAGVFFDIDARQIGLSGLDSTLTVYTFTGETITGSDDAYDFDGFTLTAVGNAQPNFDAATYADLPAGDYFVAVRGTATATTGAYRLKVTTDTLYDVEPPQLESSPGAPRRMLLDFDGHHSGELLDPFSKESATQYRAFTYDADPTTFSPLERRTIERVWQLVAEDYAPFNVNVTTRFTGNPNVLQFPWPGYGVPRTDYRVLFVDSPPNIELASARRGSYLEPQAWKHVGYVFWDNFDFTNNGTGVSSLATTRAVEMANSASATFATALGLRPYGGSAPIEEAILNSADLGVNRERWSAGMTSDFFPPTVQQDDAAAIAAVLGRRPDDFGDAASATDLGDLSVGPASVEGLIEVRGDVDAFTFAVAGELSVSLGLDALASNLDVKLMLLNATGETVTTFDPADATSGTFSVSGLDEGPFTLAVIGEDLPGRLGKYTLELRQVPPPADVTANPGRSRFAPRSFAPLGPGRSSGLFAEVPMGDAGMGALGGSLMQVPAALYGPHEPTFL